MWSQISFMCTCVMLVEEISMLSNASVLPIKLSVAQFHDDSKLLKATSDDNKMKLHSIVTATNLL